ncbi:hypothetical protein T484DRAFT_1965228, partial [Baffinella frigidus]
MLAPTSVMLLVGQLVLTPPWHHDPCSHCVHSPPWSPYHPALQVQSKDESLPIGDREFKGQLSFSFPPTQNLSAGHLVHAPPSTP